MINNNLTTISIKTHLKKFMLKHFDEAEPFKLDSNTSIGKKLLSSVKEKREYENMNEQVTDTIQLKLSTRFAARAPRAKHLTYLNTLLEEMFRESLILWVYAQGEQGVNPNQSTKGFLRFYGIEEREYSYDAAYKIWQRFKASSVKKVRIFKRSRPKF